MDNLDIALKVVEDQNDALDHLRAAIATNGDLYMAIIALLKAAATSNYARRIIITGVGKNANIAAKASETFASLGIPSMFLNTCHYSHGDAGFIGHDDVVIHVSRSGKTAEMLGMATHLRHIRPNVRQILLHCNSELLTAKSQPFTCMFGVDGVVECDEHALAPTTSTTVLLTLLDTIGINLSRELKFKREDFLKYHPGGSLGAMLEKELR